MARLSNFKSSDDQQQVTYEYVRVDKSDILNAPTCFVNAVKRSGDFGDYWIVNVVSYASVTIDSAETTSDKLCYLLPSSESRDKLLTAMNEANCYIHNVQLVQKEFTPKGMKSVISMYQFVSAVNGPECPCSWLRTVDAQPEPGITFVQFEALQHGIHLDKPFCLTSVSQIMDGTHWSPTMDALGEKTHWELTVNGGKGISKVVLKRTEGRDRLFGSILKQGEFPVHGCMFTRKSFTPQGQTEPVSYYDLISPEIEICPCGEHLSGPDQLDTDGLPW